MKIRILQDHESNRGWVVIVKGVAIPVCLNKAKTELVFLPTLTAASVAAAGYINESNVAEANVEVTIRY